MAHVEVKRFYAVAQLNNEGRCVRAATRTTKRQAWRKDTAELGMKNTSPRRLEQLHCSSVLDMTYDMLLDQSSC